ncbi:MAG TPA: patatin-like phospholipase family protein [Kofleriaceae bacterium]|nr:patatin-like phospholipase family protein [Kofleriaceae bacterium]
MSGRSRIALVLSGGGSRGAYEAGVIRYLRERLPRVLGHPVHFDIVTGTSVGAINASFLAATAERPETQAADLCAAWRSLRIEDLFSLGTRDLVRAASLLLGRDPPPPQPGTFRYGGLLETHGLERFVLRTIPWQGIRRNLRAGHLDAISISATHVGSGHTVVFIQCRDKVPTSWSKDPFVRHRIAAIGPRHALASAAIPMMFPAVKIGRGFYVDGGLRQNTPMSPAIRLGADRLLVITLRHVASPQEQAIMAESRELAYPKPLFLAGKALNALMLDHTDYDIDRMERLNCILAAGEQAFGSHFTEMLGRELIRLRGAPIRPLRAARVRPSVDIGAIASDFVSKGRIALRGRLARRLIHRLAQGEASHESDLLSYLLFDGNFAAALIDLGFSDAAASEEELAQLFSHDLASGPDQAAPAVAAGSGAID